MRVRNKRRLSLENLEARYALATATVSGGNLTVTEMSTAADLLVEQIDADTWEVTDRITNTPVGAGTFNGVTGNVTVRTGSAADIIEVDLNDLFPAPKCLIISGGNGANDIYIHDGSVALTLDVRLGGGGDEVLLENVIVNGTTSLNLGHGNNIMEVLNSTFSGRTTVVTGNGNDDVTLGDDLGAVLFENSLIMRDFGGPTDTLQINDDTIIEGSLSLDNWNEVQVDELAEVHGNLSYNGGFNVLNELVLDGTVDGDLRYYGNRNTDLLTLNDTSTVGGTVTAYLSSGNDVATFAGLIGRVLNVDGNLGNDTVNVLATAQINTRSHIILGKGADFLDFSGTIGVSPSTSGLLQVDAGTGADQVAIRAAATINGQLNVNMGADNDAFALDDAATLTSGSINGGTGTDDYYGDPARPNVNKTLFENFFFPLPPPF